MKKLVDCISEALNADNPEKMFRELKKVMMGGETLTSLRETYPAIDDDLEDLEDWIKDTQVKDYEIWVFKNSNTEDFLKKKKNKHLKVVSDEEYENLQKEIEKRVKKVYNGSECRFDNEHGYILSYTSDFDYIIKKTK